MARSVIPDALTVNDVVLACGGKIENKENDDTPEIKLPFKNKKTEYKETKKINKQTFFTTLLLILIIPVTIYLGMNYLGNRKYFLTSLLIIFETLIPFFMLFEKNNCAFACKIPLSARYLKC